MKTAQQLLEERRPIEDQLAAWLKEWDGLSAEKGWTMPNGGLRPIEDVLREKRG